MRTDEQWLDVLDLHFDKRLRDFVHTSFPANIVAINSNNSVNVQPLITTRRPDGSSVTYPVLYNVKLHTYSCQRGDVFISLPIRVGDLVWVFISERDTSQVMLSDCTSPSASTVTVTHDLSDAFCIPAFFPDSQAKQFDTEAIVIANKTSTIRITDTGVEIETQNASVKATEFTVEASSMVVNANLQVNGNTSLQGSVEASGGTFKHNNVDVGSTHTHSAVTAGTDFSGVPKP